jgi:hypothetical protein
MWGASRQGSRFSNHSQGLREDQTGRAEQEEEAVAPLVQPEVKRRESKVIKMGERNFEKYLENNFEDDGSGPGAAYSDAPLELVPCSTCHRKFQADRLTQHENVCSKLKHGHVGSHVSAYYLG